MKRRRFGRGRRSNTLSRLGGRSYGMFRQIGFPRQRFVLMRTVFLGALPASTGAVQEVTFLANSINDPFNASATVRPTTWGEWNAFYSSYRVHGAKMSCWLYPYEDEMVSNPNPGTMLSSLTCTSNSMVGWSSSDIFASGVCKFREWQPDGYDANHHTNIGQMRYLQKRPHFTAYYSAKKYFQIKDVKDQVDLEAVFAADPVTPAYFRYNWVHFGVAPTGALHQARWELDQIVELIDPKQHAVEVPA